MSNQEPRQTDSESSIIVRSDRGLSDAVTVLLLIGIAVIAVGLLAVFVFDLVPTGQDSVQASLDFDQDNDTITVFHEGGDQLPDDVTVEATGAAQNNVTVHTLGGISSGQEGTITLSAGTEGDRISVVYDGTIIDSFDLTETVS